MRKNVKISEPSKKYLRNFPRIFREFSRKFLTHQDVSRDASAVPNIRLSSFDLNSVSSLICPTKTMRSRR